MTTTETAAAAIAVYLTHVLGSCLSLLEELRRLRLISSGKASKGYEASRGLKLRSVGDAPFISKRETATPTFDTYCCWGWSDGSACRHLDLGRLLSSHSDLSYIEHPRPTVLGSKLDLFVRSVVTESHYSHGSPCTTWVQSVEPIEVRTERTIVSSIVETMVFETLTAHPHPRSQKNMTSRPTYLLTITLLASAPTLCQLLNSLNLTRRARFIHFMLRNLRTISHRH